MNKKGEVVAPAGGETGKPRCLAEVRKLREAVLLHFNSQKSLKNANYLFEEFLSIEK